jgi:hypothetical protein
MQVSCCYGKSHILVHAGKAQQAALAAKELSAAQEAKARASECCKKASELLVQKQTQLNEALAAASTAADCAGKQVAIAKYTSMGIDAQMEALKHARLTLVRSHWKHSQTFLLHTIR